MSVQHSATVTCNQCGSAATLPMSSSLTPYWNGPPGWLTVSYTTTHPMFYTGTATPDDLRNQRPDLCSWGCVSLYAREKAEEHG